VNASPCVALRAAQEQLTRYEYGGPSGESCFLFDLEGAYSRLFSPRSWREM
jgi:hypothetical protein